MEQPFLEYSTEFEQQSGEALTGDLGLTATSVKRIEMGEVSYVYKVDTKEKGNLIVKIFKLSEFVPTDGKFEWIEEQLDESHVPFARTLLISRDSKYFHYGYMVQEFIEGKNGFDAIMEGDIPFEEFFNQMVAILQKIHGITPDKFGEFPEWAGNPKPLSEIKLTGYQRDFERLKKLFLLSIPLFIFHGIEEFAMSFYSFDPMLFSHLGENAKILYILSQILLIIVALIFYSLLSKNKLGLVIAILWGLLLIFELEHAYRALSFGRYTPGLFSSFLLVVLGIFYWKELIKSNKLNLKV